VKSVLVTIAGTTASALGQIRQSLYDKTDGVEAIERLNHMDISCTWADVVDTMIDRRTVLAAADTVDVSLQQPQHQNQFSLWAALFSNTFSSLVHSILSTSFLSVHTSVISTLRDSLSRAPSMEHILPHEAYRNTLQVAMDLDRSLRKVSEDAHELLVHAEERVESERRLRQSLYVQTCEIMGRLICELRRMATAHSPTRNDAKSVETDDDEVMDATKELVIGRLCFILKFRLTSLRTLLSPDSSPARLHSTGGMISLIDLQSAFELADDNQDGLISFDEAIEAVESAFSGTPFHGDEIVRETLLLSTDQHHMTNIVSSIPTNVTLIELTLLTARGLRHDGTNASALHAVQTSLDFIITECFHRWAKSSLSFSLRTLKEKYDEFVECASTLPDEEWQRMFGSFSHATAVVEECRGVSPYIVGFILDIGSILNGNIAPSDCLSPIPTVEYAAELGIIVPQVAQQAFIPTLMDTIRGSLLDESLYSIASVLNGVVAESGAGLAQSGPTALIQLHVDISFVRALFVEKKYTALDSSVSTPTNKQQYDAMQLLDSALRWTDQLLSKVKGHDKLTNMASKRHQRVFETSDLFVSSLLGQPVDDITSSSTDVSAMEGTISDDPIFYLPLASSRRFVLLPVQADRSLADIQLRGKYAKEKEDALAMDRPHESTSGNVISDGFGFLSNMLKTKK
jgi:hypothetical protein